MAFVNNIDCQLTLSSVEALEPAIGYVNRFRKDSSLSNKTKEPTHFHYEHVDFDTLQVREHNFSPYYMV